MSAGAIGGVALVRTPVAHRAAEPWIGVRTDALFLRGRESDVGFGPYAEATILRGSRPEIGGGGAVLLPIDPLLPLVVSGGLYARRDFDERWRAGAAGELFVGGRSVNYHAAYGMASGVLVGLRYGLAERSSVAVTIGARLDLELVALPFMLLWSALR